MRCQNTCMHICAHTHTHVPARSGVAKERKVFMDLMRNEIDRVNTVLAQSGQGGCRDGADRRVQT